MKGRRPCQLEKLIALQVVFDGPNFPALKDVQLCDKTDSDNNCASA